LAGHHHGDPQDDDGDYRPGQKAAREFGVRGPLKEADMGKQDIRAVAKVLGVPVWDKPAMACFSSRIPYGSKVVFPDRACTAVDTGRAVISRKAARLCGRTANQLKAIVVDRFFETKREADAWTDAHSEFMMLRVVPVGTRSGSTEP